MTTIQFRRGIAANIQVVNPIPFPGELILETDTKKFKIGDGINHYNSLPYVGIPGNNLSVFKGTGIGNGKLQVLKHHLGEVPSLIVTPIGSETCIISFASEENIYIKCPIGKPYKYAAVLF
jgi:hypothetical protein